MGEIFLSGQKADIGLFIENVSYYPEGDPDRLQIMNTETVEGFRGVLLNTKDVEAIAVVYYGEDEV